MAAINPASLRETFQILLFPASDNTQTHFSTFPLDFSLCADSPPDSWATCFLFSASPSTSGLHQRLLSLIHSFPHFQQCLFAPSCVLWIFLSFPSSPRANSSPFAPCPHPLLSSTHNSHSVPDCFLSPVFCFRVFPSFLLSVPTLSSATWLLPSVSPRTWQGLLSLFFTSQLAGSRPAHTCAASTSKSSSLEHHFRELKLKQHLSLFNTVPSSLPSFKLQSDSALRNPFTILQINQMLCFLVLWEYSST